MSKKNSLRTEVKKAKRGVVTKLALLAAALVAGLAIAEGGVRLMGFAPRINRLNPQMRKTVYRVSENPLLGYVFKENYRDADDPDLKSSYPYINAHGFRDVERNYEKPGGVKRVILLGDSIVAGAVNIRELGDTISSKLERKLGNENVEVLNMGINGYSTLAQVELLRERGLPYSPGLVILIFSSNDYLNINSDLGKVTLPPMLRELFVRSHLFRYVGVRFNLFQLRTYFGVQEIAGEFGGFLGTAKGAERARQIRESDGGDAATVRAHFEAMGTSNVHTAIPRLKRLSAENGFALAIGFWPLFADGGIADLETWNVEKPILVRDKPLELERLAEEHQIPYFRFSVFFARDLAARGERGELERPNPKDFYTDGDDMHPNPVGAAVASEALAEILAQNPGLLGEADPAPAR